LAVVAAISQWRRRHSACVRALGGHFEHILLWITVQFVKLILTKFLHLWIY